MKIKIVDKCAYGELWFKSGVRDLEDRNYYPTKPLYNFEWDLWMNPLLNCAIVHMRGSIISMMQFRKYILLNNPDVLIED